MDEKFDGGVLSGIWFIGGINVFTGGGGVEKFGIPNAIAYRHQRKLDTFLLNFIH